MARVSNEESIAMGPERVMKDKWFRSSHSVLVSTIQSTISWVLSLFNKAEPPPSPPTLAPLTTQLPLPPPPPLISDSTAISFSPNSSTFRYQPSPPNPTIFEQNEHVVDIPTTTDSSSDEALLAPMRCPWKARPTSTRYSGESSTTSEGTNLPVSIVENTNNNTQVSPQPITQPPHVLNPTVKLLRDQELGKTVLTIVIPMTTAVLSVYTKDSSSLTLPLTLLSLCMGLAALWNGILIRNRFPNVANGVEQFGAASIFFAFFLVVSSLLPPKFVWLPWACFVAILFPSALSFVATGDTFHTPVN